MQVEQVIRDWPPHYTSLVSATRMAMDPSPIRSCAKWRNVDRKCRIGSKVCRKLVLAAPVGSARINLAGVMSVTVMGVEEERGRSARPATVVAAAALVGDGAVVVGKEEDGAVVLDLPVVELGVVVAAAAGQDKVVVAVAIRNEENGV